MYVCICNAVTEERVKAAIDAGAKNVEDVTADCCAGGDCGACRCVIEEMIEERWGSSSADAAVRLPVVRERAA